MINKTDDELRIIIDKRSQFQKEAVLAAIWELEKRNKADSEIKDIESQLLFKEDNFPEKAEVKEQKDSSITDDPNAPLLFTSKYIVFYGGLFSVFAGGILMAMNFSRLNKVGMVWLTIITALSYSVIQVIILEKLNISSLAVPLSFLGMYLLEAILWKNKVPKDLKYRKRNIWVSLTIGLLITGLYLYFVITSLL